MPVAPLAIALDRNFCLGLFQLTYCLHWHSGEFLAKPPGLPWSVSALSHASLQRR